MKYDLFLSDFDGTLVRADGTISQKNIEAITKYREKGGVFAVVTGRMPSSILPRLKELGLTEGLVVSYQGATVTDIKTGKTLKDDGFTPENALKALRVLEDGGFHIHVYTLENFYCNMDDEALKGYERVCKVKATLIQDELLSEKIEREKLRIVKLLSIVPIEDRDSVKEVVQKTLGPEFNVTCSSRHFVEVLPAGVSKANAVRYLADYYHIPIEKVAAIGDQLNDLPMIQASGGKFAVGNAVSELKDIATVVPSVEEDGVAVALKRAMTDE